MSHGKFPVAPRQQEARYIVSPGLPAQLLAAQEFIDKRKVEIESAEQKEGNCGEKGNIPYSLSLFPNASVPRVLRPTAEKQNSLS